MIAHAILSCWLRIFISPRFYLGTVLKPTVIHTICILYTPTLLLCMSACISLRLSFPFIVCSNRWTMDGLRCMPMLSLKMNGRSLGSRLGLSTPVGSNFGQTTVALIWVWVYRVAQKVGLSCVISNKLFCCSFK